MILKCTKCHHEIQSVEVDKICDWCGAETRPIGDCYMSKMPKEVK